MEFPGDAFISYAHLDNVELVEGRKGWVANLHRALEVRVAQLLGKPPQIWRDPKLAGNDLFETSIIERLRKVAVLVAVVSPRYLKSEWTIRELEAFWSAAEQQGGIHVRDKARVFKVLKTPVAVERMPPHLRGLLGYEFFRVDPESGKVRELDEVFGEQAHRDFWLKLDDLAHDICTLLEAMDTPEDPPAACSGPRVTAGQAIYLAETSSDLRDQREALRRDLQQQGLRVLPDATLPLVASDVTAAVSRYLGECRLSVHLVGRHYGVVPEGGSASIVELQHELAVAHSRSAPLARLVWIPAGLSVDDGRQQQVIERLRVDPRVGHQADLVETYFEDFRTTLQSWLLRASPRAKGAADAVGGRPAPLPTSATPRPTGDAVFVSAPPVDPPRLYLVADERDVAAIEPWAEWFFDQGLEVMRPLYDGDEREIREYHEENLVACDGLVIFYGAGSELWVRRKLRDVQKAAGLGRTRGRPVVGVCLAGPRTPEKDRFRTHEATVVAQWDGLSTASLDPVVAAIKAARGH